MTKAVQYDSYGDIQVLKLRDVQLGEVRAADRALEERHTSGKLILSVR